MRHIASRAPRLKAMGRPKALGNRRSGRAGEPAAGGWAGVGRPCRPVLRSSGAAAAEGGCPAGPAASLLPARWPDASPARSLWVIISAPWNKAKATMAGVPRTCSRRCGREIFCWRIGPIIPTPFASSSPNARPGETSGPCPSRIDPPAFSGWLDGQRNGVERFFNKLKHCRAVATRYDKRDDNYLASVKLASLRIWLRFNESVA